MKLGDDSNFIEVIEAPNAGMPGIYAVRAKMSDSLSECAIRNEAVVFDSSEAIRAEFARFSSFESQSFVLPTGGSGAITLTRDRRGAITVSYRIPSWEADAALEGRVHIEGEFSTGLLREFKALLESR